MTTWQSRLKDTLEHWFVTMRTVAQSGILWRVCQLYFLATKIITLRLFWIRVTFSNPPIRFVDPFMNPRLNIKMNDMLTRHLLSVAEKSKHIRCWSCSTKISQPQKLKWNRIFYLVELKHPIKFVYSKRYSRESILVVGQCKMSTRILSYSVCEY